MKFSTFLVPGLLSASVSEQHQRGRFATIDDREHYSKNGPNLDYSRLCLEGGRSGIIDRRPDMEKMPFTNSQARNGVAAFLKKNRPHLTAKESEKIIDSTMSQLKKDYIDRGYHDSPNCLNLYIGYYLSDQQDDELKQIRELELEREAIETNKNNPVGFSGALTGLQGCIYQNVQQALNIPFFDGMTPYVFADLVGQNLISGTVAGYLYGVKSDNFPTSMPAEQTREKMSLVGSMASMGCMAGRAMDVPGTCITGAVAGGLVGASVEIAVAKKYYLASVSTVIATTAALYFLKRDRPLKANASLLRMTELVDLITGDDMEVHGNYDIKEWQRACDDLIQDTHRNKNIPQQQKDIVINVVNELRSARNNDHCLRMPMNDGTGNVRNLNDNESILILNLLAARMRRR